MHADLTIRLGAIRFAFETAKVVDRSPSPDAESEVLLEGRSMLGLQGSTVAEGILNEYPAPPDAFGGAGETEVAVDRWRQYRHGRSLEGAAYFVITILEYLALPHTGQQAKRTRTRKQEEAAKLFKIDGAILDLVGELSSERGGPKTARKFGKKEMKPEERDWLDRAVVRLIIRLGEQQAGAVLTPITTVELPLP
jgi:hypothetical protein